MRRGYGRIGIFVGLLLFILLFFRHRNTFEKIRPEFEHDVIITVKTTQANYGTRLIEIAESWFQGAENFTVFVTDDTEDEELPQQMRRNVIPTPCKSNHDRDSLACKLETEVEHYMTQKAKWYCHFDDDNYVNIAALRRHLLPLNHSRRWYIGRPVTADPLKHLYNKQEVHFWFATGGAGYCLSRGTVDVLRRLAGERVTVKAISDETQFTDDVVMAFILHFYANITLTVDRHFHSHIELMHIFNDLNIQDEISLSYMLSDKRSRSNIVNIRLVTNSPDSSRFRAIHCILHRQTCTTPKIPPASPRGRR